MIKTRVHEKNKISQLFAMRTAIAKSRYKNPVGFFRGAQAINLSAHSFPGQDSGFPVPSDSQESSERTRTKRTLSDCPSVRRTCRKYIYQGVPMEDSKKSTSNIVGDRYLAVTAMMHVSQPIANEWPMKPPFDNQPVL